MKNLVFILLLATSATAYSQTENPFDTIKPLKKESFRQNEKLDRYLDFDATSTQNNLSSSKTTIYEPFDNTKEVKTIELNLPPLNIYTGPPLESNTFTRNPFANDYSYYSGLGSSNRLWMSSSSIQSTYPTLGSIRMVSLNLNYQPFDWLIVSGGSYTAKYNLGGHSFNDTGINGNLKFIVHDRIRFNAYGQYSVYGKQNNTGGMMGMFPQSYYGGSIELKITQKFGVEGGVIRELNPFNGKWENRTFVAPVFYAK
ncbi:MAG: hypothetical protein ACK5KT_13120 [Dysgonomonas sp.]